MSRESLHAALLDYARSPGKYPAAQRQPALLFGSIPEILHIAVGRAADGTDKAEQDAACFFIRSALFHPGADHYALLGLTRDVSTAELKDRYRLLMRLIHPDFSAGASGRWPADCAVRVNLAHDALSSPVRRREYDATLDAPPIPQPGRIEHRRVGPVLRPARRTTARSGYKKIVMVCGAAGGLILLGLLTSGPDSVHLVQRQPASQAPAPVVAQMEPAPIASHTPPPPPPPVAAAPAPAPEAVSVLVPVPAPVQAPVAKRAPAPKVVPVPPRPKPAVAPPARTAMVVAAAPPPTPAPRPAAVAPQPVSLPVVAVMPVAAPVVALAPPPPAPPAPPPRPAPVAGLSLAEAQPLLSLLLQHLESGRGDRLLNMLERDARNQPGAQALSRQYERLVEGMKPVRLSHVDFRAEPADGRLLVIGNIGLQGGEPASTGKRFVVRAEFASRAGNVVMTGLSGDPGN